MSQHIQELQSQLTRLLKATHDMNACLLEEQAALSGVDSELIMAISEQKKSVLKQLETQAIACHKALTDLGIDKGLSGLSDWLAQKTQPVLTDARQDWLKIQDLTKANKTLNDANGACIAISQRQAQRSIDILRGQQGAASQTYGRDGSPQGSSLGLRHTVV